MKIISRSIRNQIVFWAGLCLLISNIAGIAFSTLTLKQQAEQARLVATTAGKEKAAAAARDIAGVYRDQLNTALDVSRELAQSLAVITYLSGEKTGVPITPNRETVSAMLKGVIESNPHLIGIYTDWEPNAFDGNDINSVGSTIADQQGRFTVWWARSSTEVLELQSNDFTYADEIQEDYYRIPMESKQETLVEPYIDQVDGKPYLMTSLIVPIMSGEKFLGITGVDIAITELQTQVDDLAGGLYDGTAQIDIVSNGGILVARSGSPNSAGKPFKEIDPQGWNDISSFIQHGTSTLDDNVQEIKLFAPIQVGAATTPWTVVLTVSKEKLTELADGEYEKMVRLLWIMIGLGVLFTAFALVFLWQSVKAITRPIPVTAEFLSQVAKGDISQDVPQALLERSDEIGSLIRSIQSLLENLRRIFTELNVSVDTLGGSSNQLLSISEQTIAGASQSSARANAVAVAAEEMSATTSSVASGVDLVTMNLTSIAATTEEMSATISEIANSSEKARTTTLEAVAQAERMSVLMKEMGVAAQKIGKVTETITGISRQTNLLALNATIEAARAGQAGRGFAVVANEIRDLARQTAESTDEIKASIASVQSATAGTVKEIETNVQVIREVNRIVTLIVESIQAHNIATQDIAMNIAEASQGVTDANQRVRQTADVAQTIAEEISGVSLTASEMVIASEQVQASAEELSRVADQLRQIVAQFHG